MTGVEAQRKGDLLDAREREALVADLVKWGIPSGARYADHAVTLARQSDGRYPVAETTTQEA